MAKSYYAILGLSSGASPEDIRSSYRRLVKEYHPDLYSGDRSTFHDIQEAYGVLGDEQRRRQYEQQLRKVAARPRPPRRPGPAPEPLIPGDGPGGPGDISLVRSFQTANPSFDEVFDWLQQNRSNLGPKSGRVEHLTMEVPLSMAQAYRGGTARVIVPTHAVCPACHGAGRTGHYRCQRCAGEGTMAGEIPVMISFPPGLVGDHAVRVPLDRIGIYNLHLTVLFRPVATW